MDEVRLRDQRGFTLIELMVVVLIIGVLVGIALPTLLGARIRAQDRAAQALIRYGYTAEKAYAANDGSFTEDTTELDAIESTVSYAVSDTPVTTDVVYVHRVASTNEIFLSGKSVSGRCFYVRDTNGTGAAFAEDATCSAAGGQTYLARW